MPQPLKIDLNENERVELERVRDRGEKAYQRERAAAILKVADGMSALEVAEHGLLKRRKCETVCEWVHRYEQEGLGGLSIRQGRGRKAAFFPTLPDGNRGQGRTIDDGTA